MSPFSDKVTSDYVRARAELDYRELKSAGPRPAGRERSLPVDTVFPSVFTADKNHPVDHVIVTAQEWNSLRRTMAYRFWSDARQWTLLYGDGRTMIFGWNDLRRPGSRFAAAEFDPVPGAFRSQCCAGASGERTRPDYAAGQRRRGPRIEPGLVDLVHPRPGG